MNMRHITRFTYEFTNFQGWRVAINRQGIALARYFSDKQYGDSEKALAQALNFRDMVLLELKQKPDFVKEVLLSHRAQESRVYPAGLKPACTAARESEAPASSFSMRSNKVLHHILQRVCKHLRLDTASVLKLSLYLFAVQYGAQGKTPDVPFETHSVQTVSDEQHVRNLQRIISELETAGRLSGMPDFAEFSTGRSVGKLVVPSDNDIVPYDNSHAAERYMRSARPSPPQAASTLPTEQNMYAALSVQSLPIAPGHSPSPLPLAVCHHRDSKFIPYSSQSSDVRPHARKRNRTSDDFNLVPPPDAM